MSKRVSNKRGTNVGARSKPKISRYTKIPLADDHGKTVAFEFVKMPKGSRRR